MEVADSTFVQGTAIDLAQLVPLVRDVLSRVVHSHQNRIQSLPTLALRRSDERDAIDNSPPSFDYASYYNYFLFYAAVALCFGALQPLTLAIACLYFGLDYVAKKYMILYIFVTEYESGGMFWPTLHNRILVSLLLSNIVIALLVAAQGGKGQNWIMLTTIVPLPGLLGLFKWHCSKTFEGPMRYYCVNAQGSAAESTGEMAAKR